MNSYLISTEYTGSVVTAINKEMFIHLLGVSIISRVADTEYKYCIQDTISRTTGRELR